MSLSVKSPLAFLLLPTPPVHAASHLTRRSTYLSADHATKMP